jgi:hypothetical protein
VDDSVTRHKIGRYIFSEHAKLEMKRRGLSPELVGEILRKPEQVDEVRRGRLVFQARAVMGSVPKQYMIRVFVDVDREPAEVVTAYRTSKIAKYWETLP